MIRALLVFALLLAVPSARAGLSFRQLNLDSAAVLEIEVPADSDLTLGSRNSVNGKVWQEYALTARAEPRDSMLRVRQILSAKDTVRLCRSLEPLAGCQGPRGVETQRSVFWPCAADFFLPVRRYSVVKESLGREAALRVLRRTMLSDTDWTVYRYDGLEKIVVQPGTRNAWELGVAPAFWSSPWVTKDRVEIKGQWRHPDTVWSRGGKDSLLIYGMGPYVWHFAGGEDTSTAGSLRTLGLSRDVQVIYECLPRDTLAAGSRRLLTKNGSFVVVGDSVAIDSVIGTVSNDLGYSEASLLARSYLALPDLDSLLRHMPVCVPAYSSKTSPVRISSRAATLDAGNVPGRLELVDARGQILSKASGQGMLRLPLQGQGVRWVRWRRGSEQGSLPVVF